MNTALTDSATSSRMRRPSATLLLAAACLFAGQLCATPPFGFTSQTFRGRIAGNVGAHQWNPDPLFTLLIQSSNDLWGFDVVQGTTEFAPMDAMGRPSQSGWHDHPTALSIGLVIQGTVWSQQHPNLHCARAIPTGSVFFERSGEIHNNYNFDPRIPAVVRIIHFVDRNQTATRRDRPDQVTGDPTTASPPPPPCPADTPTPHAGIVSPVLWPANGSIPPAEQRLSAPPPAALLRRRSNGHRAVTAWIPRPTTQIPVHDL